MLRILGLLFVGLGATAAALDFTAQREGGFEFTSLGGFWFKLHKESLIGLQSGLENRVQPGVWEALEPALHWPAAPTLGGLGVALIMLGMFLKVRRAERRSRRI